MFNVGGGELLVIALIALIVLGPQRLPEAARTVGKVVGEIRRLSTGFQREIRDAFEDADQSNTGRRRPERAPLAAAVDDVDSDVEPDGDDLDPLADLADPDAPPVARPDPDAPPASRPASRPGSGPATNGADGLAPEVGDAIDQVVAATNPTDDRSDDVRTGDSADAPEDGPGDARAAS